MKFIEIVALLVHDGINAFSKCQFQCLHSPITLSFRHVNARILFTCLAACFIYFYTQSRDLLLLHLLSVRFQFIPSNIYGHGASACRLLLAFLLFLWYAFLSVTFAVCKCIWDIDIHHGIRFVDFP